MDQTQQDEINLRELIGLLWQGRWVLLAVTLTTTALAVIAAQAVPKKYTAEIVISPSSMAAASGGLGGMGSQLGSLAGLASMAGITIGEDSGKAEALAILQSQTLTERYIRDNDLLPVLFADDWDPQAKKWTVTNPKRMPTLWKGNEFFKKKVREVTEDKKSGMITLKITWYDAKLAAQWANDLVRLTNEYLRDKKVRESERNIAYLNAEAQKTDVVQVRMSIYGIMESEIKAVMVARGSDEYALKVIDPARVPERSSFPPKLIWIFGGFFLGAIGAAVFLVVRRAWADAPVA